MRRNSPSERDKRPVSVTRDLQSRLHSTNARVHYVEAKAKKELLDRAKGKGPLNTGQQGIKKSGKK
jgi:hypothetical protein